MKTKVLFGIALIAVPALSKGGQLPLDAEMAARFADLALACVHQEYPNKIAHVLNSDGDVKPPRELTPAFCGCFDWHSSVHGHWLLARLARTFPDAPFAAKAREVLAADLTPEKIAAEVRYVEGQGRATFERPYGLAWLLQLSAELKEWDDRDARRWAIVLEPLERVAATRIKTWLPKLSRPIRIGEHEQSAFAFGLIADWAKTAGDVEMFTLIESKGHSFYYGDRNCPIAYEPSGQDFFSPCLGEADLARRFMPPPQFAVWLSLLLPGIPLDGSAAWLVPAVVTDRSDGKLVHLDGLNLSRAWMLEGIAAGLPEGDPRQAALLAAAAAHKEAGLASLASQQYEGSHWLGTFATYLATRRGVGGSR